MDLIRILEQATLLLDLMNRYRVTPELEPEPWSWITSLPEFMSWYETACTGTPWLGYTVLQARGSQ